MLTQAQIDAANIGSQETAANNNAKVGAIPGTTTVPTPGNSAPGFYGQAPGGPPAATGADGQPLSTTEPSVISSGNITDTVIPNMVNSAAALAQKGTYVDSTGATRYSDGSAVPAPVDAEFDPTTNTWKSGTTSYAAGPQFVDNTDNDPDVQKTNELFDSMKASLDSSTLTQVNAIQQQYDLLRQSQQTANAAADKARAVVNIKGGTTQFAPLDAAGTALAQTTFGLQQISKLDADENTAISQVKTAQANGDFQLMSKALDTATSIRADKQATAQKIADQLSAANDVALKQSQQVAQDNAVAGLVGQGVTDPSTVLKALNDAGYNVTADQVATSLKSLQTTTTAGNAYKFANTDIGSLLGAGLTMPQVQAIQDFYNGKGSSDALSGLSTAQQTAVHTALAGKPPTTTASGTKAYTSGTLSYTSADLADGNAKLQASKGADNYVDPNLYLNMANAWTGAGGSIKDFIKNYPVSSWVNPANTFVGPAIDALVKQDAGAVKTTSTTSTSATGRSI